MIHCIKLTLAPILVLCYFIPTQSQTTTSNPKNVVIVLVDDLGWNDVGYAGSTLYQTPHLDKLAKESTVFTQAYSGHPVCSPSRAAILTGKHPTRLGITDWIPGQRPENRPLQSPTIHNELALEEATMAEYFKEAGYRTFFAGKWHLGSEPYTPENQGFDENVGGIDKGSPPGGYYAPYQNAKLSDGPEGEYLTDRLTTETIRFIRENQAVPFFAFLSFYTVHTPIQASIEDRALYDGLSIPATLFREHKAYNLLYQSNLDYASMVTAMDRNVGRLITSLKNLALWDNTVFVFTSDNGGLSTLEMERAAPTNNSPLRAGKGWCYEGGIRIPQLIYAPGLSDQQSRIDRTTIHQDILPTVWQAAGLGPVLPPDLDGRNIFMNQDNESRTFFWDYPHYHGSGWTPGTAIRHGDWKLIHWYEDDVVELYNLQNDPGESIDLSKRHPEKMRELKLILHQKVREYRSQIPKPNSNYRPAK